MSSTGFMEPWEAELLEGQDPTAYCDRCKVLFRTAVCHVCYITRWEDGGGAVGRCPELVANVSKRMKPRAYINIKRQYQRAVTRHLMGGQKLDARRMRKKCRQMEAFEDVQRDRQYLRGLRRPGWWL